MWMASKAERSRGPRPPAGPLPLLLLCPAIGGVDEREPTGVVGLSSPSSSTSVTVTVEIVIDGIELELEGGDRLDFLMAPASDPVLLRERGLVRREGLSSSS